MVRALWQSSGEAVAPISGAFNEDTPACDRHRGFLAAGALVCGSADSDRCPSPLDSGLAPEQAPLGVGPLPLCSLPPPAPHGPLL